MLDPLALARCLTRGLPVPGNRNRLPLGDRLLTATPPGTRSGWARGVGPASGLRLTSGRRPPHATVLTRGAGLARSARSAAGGGLPRRAGLPL
ncbi:MAG TPA: hypothetical protein VFA92_16045, partial [Candidatus Binatia bacterium]|nr:hypothetical protein [Candidatus Binatia bacterium]